MAFIETPRFPDYLAFGLKVTTKFVTDVVRKRSGYETRNAVWARELLEFDGATTARTQAQRDEIEAFFRAVGNGRLNGFRIRNYGDSDVGVDTGILGAGIGTGLPTYQLTKRYASSPESRDVAIIKPVSGSVAVFRDASPVSEGSGAGQIAIDSTTGIITFVPDNTSSVSSVTPGSTTQVVTANNLGGLTTGQLLYLTGFIGADAALLNDLAHTINSVTGSGPYTYTLNTNTSGASISVGSPDSAAYRYPQAAEALTWSGSFDVPVRFDHDDLTWTVVTFAGGDYMYVADKLKMIELRV